jgi:predicted MFS family arabinose efflux permease
MKNHQNKYTAKTVSAAKETTSQYNSLVFILGLAGFISAADNWFISPMLPAIAGAFQTSISKAGTILTAYMIPYGIMQPVYGFFSDRRSKVRTLQAIVLGLAIGTLGCALAGSLWVLCIFRIITGFFAAGIIAVSLALIGDSLPPAKRQIYVGRFMGLVFLGQGTSAGLGGWFAKYLSWRIAFVFFATAAIIAVLTLDKLPKNAPNSILVQRKFFSEVKQQISSPDGRLVFPLALVTGFLLLSIYSYLGAFLNEVSGLDYLQVGAVTMFYGLSCLLAGSQVGKIGQKFGYQRTMVIGGCLALSAALLLMMFSYWQWGLLATIGLAFGYIFIQSTLATMAFNIASKTKGLNSGLIGLGLFGGGGLGTAVNGWLLSLVGYQMLWLFLAIGLILFIFVTAKLHFKNQNMHNP